MRWAIGHVPMSYECFCHRLDYDRSVQTSTDKFRKPVRYNQEIFFILWSCEELSQDVDGDKH